MHFLLFTVLSFYVDLILCGSSFLPNCQSQGMPENAPAPLAERVPRTKMATS